MRKIPRRWQAYSAFGHPVHGTKFLPFKVPLEERLCDNLPEAARFTPLGLLEEKPNLKAIIDLTDTYRYYDPKDFTDKGVFYRKIKIMGGGWLPSAHKIQEFFEAVDELLAAFDQEPDALIGVHCTHGLNRTGYLICKYMVARMKIDPSDAIHAFSQARGYPIERRVFINDIIRPYDERENLPPASSDRPRRGTHRPSDL